jgi:hypothetical protein
MVPRGQVLAFTTLVSILVSLCPTPASVALAQQGSNADRRQFEGFSFDLPSGWLPAVPNLAKTKADILLGGIRLGAKAEIVVDVGRPRETSPEATAKAFAKMWGGTVVPGMVDVDGEKAIQVQVSPNGDSLSPRRAIVVFHEGKLHIIIAVAAGARDVSDAIEHVRATWKWDAPGLPSRPGIEANGTVQTIMRVVGAVLTIVFGLGLLFVAYETIILLKRWFRREPAQGKGKWISLYMILAVLCAMAGMAGLWENVRLIVQGAGLPTEPARRLAFLTGLFAPPVFLFIVAAGLALLARRRATNATRSKSHVAAVDPTTGPTTDQRQ